MNVIFITQTVMQRKNSYNFENKSLYSFFTLLFIRYKFLNVKDLRYWILIFFFFFERLNKKNEKSESSQGPMLSIQIIKIKTYEKLI